MGTSGPSHRDESQGAKAQDAGRAEREPYEPPAAAWEEPFQPMAATSCGHSNPFGHNCLARPHL